MTKPPNFAVIEILLHYNILHACLSLHIETKTPFFSGKLINAFLSGVTQSLCITLRHRKLVSLQPSCFLPTEKVY